MCTTRTLRFFRSDRVFIICTIVVDVDLKSDFDTIPHDKLLARIRTKISDSRVLKLIEAFLKQKVMHGLSEWTPVRDWTSEAGLTLHPTKTKVVDADAEAFDFLGYRFEHGDRFPREKSLKKLKETLRTKTRRANGRSLSRIVADANVTLDG